MKLLTACNFDQKIAFLYRLLQLEEPLSDYIRFFMKVKVTERG